MSTSPHIDRARPVPVAAKPAKARRWSLSAAIAKAGGRILGHGSDRPIAFSAVAVAVGLIAALASLLHPAPRGLTSTPPGVVALVNQEPVLMDDFIKETEAATGKTFAETTPAERSKMLRDMIDQELVVQRALALDLPEQDTDLRSALSDALNLQIYAPVLGNVTTDDQLKAYFNSHRSKYIDQGAMNVTDLVLRVGGFENADQSVDQALADAKQAVYELRSGANVQYVMQHFAMANSGKGDTLEPDFAAKLHLGPAVYAAAQTMSDGQISEPIVAPDGVHVIIMNMRKPPQVYGFDSVRNNVFHDYQTDLEAQAHTDNLKYLRSNAQIILAPGQTE